MSEDPYGIPANMFGVLDPELPALIGRIVMLAATLENKISLLRDQLTGSRQDAHAQYAVNQNIRGLRKLLPAYGGTFAEDWFLDGARPLIERSSVALGERNEFVHRLWPHASGDLGGWKPRRGQPTADGNTTEWRNYSWEELRELVRELVALIELAGNVLGVTGGLPRHPELDTPRRSKE